MKWISVVDKPPGESRRVLLYDGQNLGWGYLESNVWTWLGLSPNEALKIPIDENRITHWMELPDVFAKDWIKISDKQPDMGQKVLLMEHGISIVYIGWLKPNNEWQLTSWDGRLPTSQVSQWMPLPDPPIM